MSTIDTTQIISIDRAAEIIGVSNRRVLQYCADGRLGQKVCGRYLVTEKEAKGFRPNPPGRPPKED